MAAIRHPLGSPVAVRSRRGLPSRRGYTLDHDDDNGRGLRRHEHDAVLSAVAVAAQSAPRAAAGATLDAPAQGGR